MKRQLLRRDASQTTLSAQEHAKLVACFSLLFLIWASYWLGLLVWNCASIWNSLSFDVLAPSELVWRCRIEMLDSRLHTSSGPRPAQNVHSVFDRQLFDLRSVSYRQLHRGTLASNLTNFYSHPVARSSPITRARDISEDVLPHIHTLVYSWLPTHVMASVKQRTNKRGYYPWSWGLCILSLLSWPAASSLFLSTIVCCAIDILS